MADEKQSVRHFSEREAQRESGRGKQRRAAQRFRQDAREFVVSNRVWRNGIDRADDRWIRERELGDADRFSQSQPGHPLPSIAEPPARAQLERQRHLSQRATVRRQDNSKSQAGHPRAELGPARGFRFPRAAKPRKKIVSRGTRFGKSFIAAAAVVTDGRCRHNHARRALQFGKRSHQMPRGVNPACPQQFLARRVPPPPGNGCSRQMNERLRALAPGRVEYPRDGVPSNGLRVNPGYVFPRGARPHQSRDRMALPLQCFHQRCAQESRRARNQNSHMESLPAPLLTLRRTRWQRQMNFGNVSSAGFADFDAAEFLEFSFWNIENGTPRAYHVSRVDGFPCGRCYDQPMPSLNFKGKALVRNFHLLVPYHELKLVKSKSLTPKVSLHDNLVVHGDNLKALKSLLPYYHGKVKCIYIDPPYNTGNEKWVYNDNVSSPMIQEWLGKVVDREDLTRHDKWLCMMLPRLKLLREFMDDKGLIGISIDENEFSSLITLCDEVFGESNLFGVVVVRNNPRGRRMGTEFAVEHEYLVLYARNRDQFPAGRLPLTDEQLLEYSEVDFEGRRCRLLGLRKRGALSRRADRPNLYYPIWANHDSGRVFLESKKGLEKILPKLSDGSDGVWRWSQTKVRAEGSKLVAREVRRRGTAERELDVFEFDYSEDEAGDVVGRLFPSIWQGSEFNNETGRDQLKELFGGKAVFDNPKPVDLIKHFLLLGGGIDGIVLDPFAGSGTTAQAVMELNNSDNGKRRFVLVEEQEFADKITAERTRRVIGTLSEQGARGSNSFSFAEVGHPMQLEALLKAEKLPSYEDLASYVFYTATGEDFDAKKD